MRLLPPHHPGSELLQPSRKGTHGLSFRGHYEHSLDSKDRLTVPSRFRAALSDGVVLAKGLRPLRLGVHARGVRAASERFLAPTQPASASDGAHAAPPLPRRLLRRDARLRRPHPPPQAADRARRPAAGPCVSSASDEYLEIWNAEAWAKQEKELDADGLRDRREPLRRASEEAEMADRERIASQSAIAAPQSREPFL